MLLPFKGELHNIEVGNILDWAYTLQSKCKQLFPYCQPKLLQNNVKENSLFLDQTL